MSAPVISILQFAQGPETIQVPHMHTILQGCRLSTRSLPDCGYANILKTEARAPHVSAGFVGESCAAAASAGLLVSPKSHCWHDNMI